MCNQLTLLSPASMYTMGDTHGDTYVGAICYSTGVIKDLSLNVIFHEKVEKTAVFVNGEPLTKTSDKWAILSLILREQGK